MDLFDIAVAKKLAGGGGGGGGITPAVEKTYNVSTTSTTAIDIDTFQVPLDKVANKWVAIIIEDTNGPRDGYFYAWVSIKFNGSSGNGGNYYKGGENAPTVTGFASSANSQYGVFAVVTETPTDRVFNIKAKFDASRVGTIDGTFKVRLFVL